MDDHDFLPGNGSGRPHVDLDTMIAGMKAQETYDLPRDWRVRTWQDNCLREFRKKHRLAGSNYFTFLVSAGVGSGKTIMSALIASYLLNEGAIERIVYVCPNRTILAEVARVFRLLNIEVVPWYERHRDREAADSNGIILSYTKLIFDTEKMGRLCDQKRTLVIFDEVHHLGDDKAWGEATKTAFEFRAAYVLMLSGTPYREDNRPIPFVTYEIFDTDGIKTFRPDYVYTLGQSILDGVCRRPVFHWLTGDVRITLDDKSKKVVNWDDELPVNLMNRRLNAAVRHGSTARLLAIQKVVEFCRRANRKLIVFVGGDSRNEKCGIHDADEYLPADLRALGVNPREICSVSSRDDAAHDKIAAFGKSNQTILCSVNMVSEGVDIPELSVALFLTSITARPTTIQRIGRILRGEGECHVYMFADPRHMKVAAEVETEIRHLIDLGKAVPGTFEARGLCGPRGEPDPLDIGLTCLEGGETINKVYYPPWVRERHARIIVERGIPEGSFAKSVVYPLIVDGMFGPVPQPPSKEIAS